jgi:phosphoribosyl 1,2-cyclic phosphodiesterase
MGGQFRAHLSFHDFAAGEQPDLHPGLRVATTALRHPGNATGYRVEWSGSSVCYITDNEHLANGVDDHLRRFVAGSDILIYDATYSEEEYQSRQGWGHSTWQAGVALAETADVGRLVLFHHDPAHDDTAMDAIERAAASRRPGTIAAREGMTMETTAVAAKAAATQSHRSNATG